MFSLSVYSFPFYFFFCQFFLVCLIKPYLKLAICYFIFPRYTISSSFLHVFLFYLYLSHFFHHKLLLTLNIFFPSFLEQFVFLFTNISSVYFPYQTLSLTCRLFFIIIFKSPFLPFHCLKFFYSSRHNFISLIIYSRFSQSPVFFLSLAGQFLSFILN